MDFTDLNEYVSLSKNTLELLKSAAGLLPKSPQRDSADIALKAATDALTRSDVKLAKDLGFPICQCELPGVPMLWKKDMGKYGKHECPKCGDIYPRDHPVLDAPSSQFDSALLGARRGGR